MSGRILLSGADAQGIARVRISHPGKLNALSVAMWHELRRAFEALSAPGGSARVVIVHGEGGTFAAGGDIEEFPQFRFDPERLRAFHEEAVAPALQAVMAGEVDFVMDPGISFQHVRAGKVNMFAVASPTRSRQFPDVSTLGEKGVPGIDHDTWAGLWLPAGTPDDIRARLSRAVGQVLAQPDVQKRMQALSGEAVYMDSPQYRQMLNQETAAFSGVIRNRKIVAE